MRTYRYSTPQGKLHTRSIPSMWVLGNVPVAEHVGNPGAGVTPVVVMAMAVVVTIGIGVVAITGQGPEVQRSVVASKCELLGQLYRYCTMVPAMEMHL